MSTHNRCSSTLLALTLAVLVLPAAVRAGTAVLVPEKFTTFLANEMGAITPTALTSTDSSSAFFTANVTLPVGATITRLTYFHWKAPAAAGKTAVTLFRTKMGAGFDVAAEGKLMVANSSAEAPLGLPPQVVSTTAPANPGSDLVVRAGYRYFVTVTCENKNNWVNGVKVVYTP